jgi:hypothetical protein
MDGRPGAEKLNQAVAALGAAAEEIVNLGEEDGSGRDGDLL